MNELTRQLCSRPGFAGSRRWPSSTSRSVGKPFSNNAFDGQIGTGDVIHAQLGPVGIGEVKFGQIVLQVRFGYVLVDPVNPAFQDGEVAFNGIGIDLVSHVFLGRVVHGLVGNERCAGVR